VLSSVLSRRKNDFGFIVPDSGIYGVLSSAYIVQLFRMMFSFVLLYSSMYSSSVDVAFPAHAISFIKTGCSFRIIVFDFSLLVFPVLSVAETVKVYSCSPFNVI